MFSTPPWGIHNFLLTIWSSHSWRWHIVWRRYITWRRPYQSISALNNLSTNISETLSWFLSLPTGFIIKWLVAALLRLLHSWIIWSWRQFITYVIAGLISMWFWRQFWHHRIQLRLIFSRWTHTVNLPDTALVILLIYGYFWRLVMEILRLSDTTCRQYSFSLFRYLLLLLINLFQLEQSFIFLHLSFSF